MSERNVLGSGDVSAAGGGICDFVLEENHLLVLRVGAEVQGYDQGHHGGDQRQQNERGNNMMRNSKPSRYDPPLAIPGIHASPHYAGQANL